MKQCMGVLAGAVAAGMLVATQVSAHGIWFAPRANQVALVYGVGSEDLDMVKRMPKVKSMTGYDEQGREVPTGLKVTGPLPLVDLANQPAIVAASLDNGLWSKTPDGKWHAKGKDEVPNAIVSEWTMKYAVHVRLPVSVEIPQLTGQTLQIVPVGNKLPDKQGMLARYRVLYEGQPVQGAVVKSDYVTDPDAKGTKTGADGTVSVRVRNTGLNVVTAILQVPPPDPRKVNAVEHLATLSFIVPHEPE